MSGQSFFDPFLPGGRQLRNRIVMAPMTRGRARTAGLVPTDPTFADRQ